LTCMNAFQKRTGKTWTANEVQVKEERRGGGKGDKGAERGPPYVNLRVQEAKSL